jgi:hypothetical protein
MATVTAAMVAELTMVMLAVGVEPTTLTLITARPTATAADGGEQELEGEEADEASSS